MDDLAGWQQTRWGMTEEEILAAASREPLCRQDREGGPNDFWYCDLVIQNVAVGGFDFTIKFQMGRETQRLLQVLINHEQSDVSQAPTAAFNAAKRILVERFGTPARDGTSDDWLWQFPTTTIRLSTLFMEDSVSNACIIFAATSDAASRPSAF